MVVDAWNLRSPTDRMQWCRTVSHFTLTRRKNRCCVWMMTIAVPPKNTLATTLLQAVEKNPKSVTADTHQSVTSPDTSRRPSRTPRMHHSRSNVNNHECRTTHRRRNVFHCSYVISEGSSVTPLTRRRPSSSPDQLFRPVGMKGHNNALKLDVLFMHCCWTAITMLTFIRYRTLNTCVTFCVCMMRM